MTYRQDRDYIIKRDKDSLRVLFDKDASSSKDLSYIGNKISNMNLERYIKPKNIKLDEYDGLESYEIDNYSKSKINKFTKLPKEDLIESLRAIRRDIKTLSDCDLMIANLELKNIKILKNKIYLAGITNISHNMDRDFSLLTSNVVMNEFFGSNGVVKENKDEEVLKVYQGIYTRFLASNKEFIEDFYDKELKSKETIKSYIKRL